MKNGDLIRIAFGSSRYIIGIVVEVYKEYGSFQHIDDFGQAFYRVKLLEIGGKVFTWDVYEFEVLQ